MRKNFKKSQNIFMLTNISFPSFVWTRSGDIPNEPVTFWYFKSEWYVTGLFKVLLYPLPFPALLSSNIGYMLWFLLAPLFFYISFCSYKYNLRLCVSNQSLLTLIIISTIFIPISSIRSGCYLQQNWGSSSKNPS